MNALPESRRAIHGRTFGQSWSARHYDPIEAHRAPPYSTVDLVIACMLVGVLICFFYGVM